MKAYTDVPQSKILAEFLPIDTADCCYIMYCTSDNIEWRYEGQPPMFLGDIPINEITAEHIPCWSLAALLDVLPTIDDEFEPQLRRSLDKYFCTYEGEEDSSGLWRVASNPVDACVEMILKLHKEGLI